jgi:hypothetical protein
MTQPATVISRPTAPMIVPVSARACFCEHHPAGDQEQDADNHQGQIHPHILVRIRPRQ